MMPRKGNSVTALRNPQARLWLTSPLFAIWITFQFPALLAAYNEAKSFLTNSKIIDPESTRNPNRAGMPTSAHAVTGFRLASPVPALPQSHSLTRSHVSKISRRLPLYFEANTGQAGEQVKFISRGRGYSLSLAANEVLMSLQHSPEAKPAKSRQASRAGNLDHDTGLHPRSQRLETVIRMKFVGATTRPEIIGTDQLPGKSHYFIGNDQKRWQKNIPQYAKVRYEEIYPGIDVIFYGNQSQLEFDFIVAPGVNPDIIQMAFEGADKIDIDKDGHLTLQSPGGSIRVKKPFIYQEQNGVRQEVSGRYLLNPPSEKENPRSSVVAFELASYDARKPLVIDPGLEFSTFVGSNGLDDGNGITLDATGNIYIVGSTGFGYGDVDVFVAKFSADFTLLYVSVFGGSTNGKMMASDWGRAIAVDASGNAYVSGKFESIDFPVTDGTSPIGYADAFVAKLSNDGSTLLFSRRLGGSGQSDAFAIALDPQGSAYVTGWTTSPEFPTTPGALNTIHPGFGYGEAFVVKLRADGSQLLYSTFLRASYGLAIAVDNSGNAHVTGGAGSLNFPATAGAFDTSYNDGGDAFVAKLNADGSQLLYATYLGGSANDTGLGIALDSTGNVYVTGTTDSSDFPTTAGAFERTRDPSSNDVFVAKLSADGSTLIYSTYLGGGNGDGVSGITLDTSGNVYVVGTTCSSDFPTTAEAFNRTFGGGCSPSGFVDGDAYFAKLSADGSRLLYSTYLGGGAGDEGKGIARDSAGNIYVVGRTESLNFPTTPGSFEPGGGPWDAFIAKLSAIDTLVNPGTISLDPFYYQVSENAGTAMITVVRRNGSDGEVRVDFATSTADSTAIAGLDYVAASGSLVFAHGETRKSFTVTILDDNDYEDTERLVVAISNAQGGATLGARNWGLLVISDQDPMFLPTLTITKTGTGSGVVTSNFPRDINCGSVCSRSYASGNSLTLTARPDSGSTFAGWSGGTCSGIGSCTFTIRADISVTATFNTISPLAIASLTFPEGEVSNAYNVAVAAAGGVDPYSLTLVNGALPPGLALNGLNLTGIPAGTGKFSFTLQLTDSNKSFVTRPFTIRILKAIAIKTANLPAGRTGRRYGGKLTATGGKAPYTWSVISGSLPLGLSVDPSTGKITGVPTGAGNFTVVFRATDALGGKSEKSVGLNVWQSSQ